MNSKGKPIKAAGRFLKRTWLRNQSEHPILHTLGVILGTICSVSVVLGSLMEEEQLPYLYLQFLFWIPFSFALGYCVMMYGVASAYAKEKKPDSDGVK